MNEIHSEYSSTDSMGGDYTDYQGETTQQTGTQATTATESSTKAQKQLQQHLRQQLLQRQRYDSGSYKRQHHRQKEQPAEKSVKEILR